MLKLTSIARFLEARCGDEQLASTLYFSRANFRHPLQFSALWKKVSLVFVVGVVNFGTLGFLAYLGQKMKYFRVYWERETKLLFKFRTILKFKLENIIYHGQDDNFIVLF